MIIFFIRARHTVREPLNGKIRDNVRTFNPLRPHKSHGSMKYFFDVFFASQLKRIRTEKFSEFCIKNISVSADKNNQQFILPVNIEQSFYQLGRIHFKKSADLPDGHETRRMNFL